MRRKVFYAFCLTALFYFSEGKPCPEKTKAHKTRCDSYYKCTELPSKVHVWLPVKCEQGLVYEHNVRACVLPSEDWECIPDGDRQTTNTHNNKDADIDIVAEVDPDKQLKQHMADENVEIVIDSGMSADEHSDVGSVGDTDGSLSQVSIDSDSVSVTDSESHEESSGDGELLELDGYMQAENREVDIKRKQVAAEMAKLGAELKKQSKTELTAEMKQDGSSMMPAPTTTSSIDPNLKAHLQRLSQLIDGLKQTYQKPDKSEQEELRPDQLNAFLAHFNIKNRFDTLEPTGSSYMAPPTTTTETPMVVTTTPTTVTRTPKPLINAQQNLPAASLNKTKLQEHLNNRNSLRPETKVVLTSALPKYYGDGQHDGIVGSGGSGGGGSGYTNSQIVVNRPEGSVLFTLPSSFGNTAFGEDGNYNERFVPKPHNDYNEPKISEETLKTVLELSKQMIAAQNVPKVIQNPYYGPPTVLQPVILAPSSHAFYAAQNPGQFGLTQSLGYQTKQYNQHGGYKKTQRPNSGAGGGNRKQGTTIIHNNVIPVHLTTTNSGEKEVVDSYGNSLGLYPPIHNSDNNQNNYNQNKNNQNNHNQDNHNNVYDVKHTLYNGNSHDDYLSAVTTARPSISITTTATHYTGQYPSPYASEITLTTPRPFNQQPTSDTIAAYYTPSPHLSEQNVNRVYQTESYSSLSTGNIPRPFDLNRRQPGNGNGGGGGGGAYNPFPTQVDIQKVKIRPNSQKIESMEDDNDDLYNANGNGNRNPNYNYNYNNNKNNNFAVTYSVNNQQHDDEDIAMSAQLAHNPYLDQTLNFGGTVKHPYIPRPTTHTQSSALNNFNFGNNNFGSSSSSDLDGYGGYGPQKTPTATAGTSVKYTNLGTSNTDPTQLVNFGGNFISLDVFQNSILPLVGQASPVLNNVEVITCQAGVRQPNITDCTRYFVCSKKDGKVLSYSCPPYTGFNQNTRICDAHTYATCSPTAIVSSYTVNENKRIQMEAYKAIQEAKKRQEAAIKAQSIANLFQQHYNNDFTAQQQQQQQQSQEQTAEKDMLSSYIQQAAAMANTFQTTTTTRPIIAQSGSVKKRKYYCREGDKIPDQTSITNYFVCYKNEQGQMKGHKMTCSKGLLFCPKTTMCTLPAKCT